MPGTSSSRSRVAILLCTYNSEKFLREQLDSFRAQSHENWELWVSDDGSADATLRVVDEFAKAGAAVHVVDGPRRGATPNFLSLARREGIDADYFAWSDADDIWLPDKLERAAVWLDGVGGDRPALYCGRTEVVDEEARFLHYSPLFAKPPCFRNSLCQNAGGGNTMVFNRAARDLLRRGAAPDVPAHDWWAYMLVSGAGGAVRYDPLPCLRYRQHRGNLVGANKSLAARLMRARRFFAGVMREWNRRNVEALEARRELLTGENREVLALFAAAMRTGNPLARLNRLGRSGVFRQSPLHNLVLRLGALMGRYP